MARIITLHSYRGGTGKSNLAANLAFLAARAGKRVGIVDADIQSPGVHTLFGIAGNALTQSLNDFLWGACAIEQAARQITGALTESIPGKIYLIPASIQARDISRILREGYDVERFHTGLNELTSKLELDALWIDTHPGLNEETLVTFSVAHALAIVLRPDEQDYEGTEVEIEVAEKLNVPRLELIVNYASPQILKQLQYKIAQTYNRSVLGVLPYSKEMLSLGSQSIFAVHYPQHPITTTLEQIAARLLA